MKRAIVVAIAILLTSTAAHAQLSGALTPELRLEDSATCEPLSGLLISIRREKDSANLYTFSTGRNGEFYLPVLVAGFYYLVIDAEGYKPGWIRFDIGQGKLALPLAISIPKQIDELQSVTVHQSPDFDIHGDTTSYLADRFHTRPFANLGELLNKLPGIEVDAEGHASFMGRIVRRVLLNGRPYFSDDPAIAIQNFPRDLVYRIEILEQHSDESDFTGVDDGVRILTINIITAREIKRTIFSNGSAGMGTDGFYNVVGNANYQSGPGTAAAVVSASNVPGGDNPSASPGIHQNLAAHFMLHDSAVHNKAFWNVGYSLDHGTNSIDRQSDIQYLLPSGPGLQTTSLARDIDHSNRQIASLRLVSRPQMHDQFIIDAHLNGVRSSNSDSLNSTADSSNLPVSHEANRLINHTHSNSLQLGLEWGHRFARQGRTLYVRLNSSRSNTIATGTNDYSTTYNLPTGDNTVLVSQRFTGPTTTKQFSLSVDYTEPLSTLSSLQLHYKNSMTTGTSSHAATFFDSLSHRYQPDSLLCSNFSSQIRTDFAGVFYAFGQGKPFSFTAGTNVVSTRQVSQNFGEGSVPPVNTLNFNPAASLQWAMRKGRSLALQYSGATTQPNLQELQPVINNTDPLHVQIGNLDLKPGFTHTLNFSLRSSDLAHGNRPRVWWLNLTATVNENEITNTTRINPLTGADTVTPVNLNGNYSFLASGGYSIPVSLIKSTLDIHGSITDQHQVGIINSKTSPSTTRSACAGFSWKSNLRKSLDGNIAANATYRITTDPLSPASNQQFWFYSLTAALTAYTDNGWQLSSQLQYTSYSGLAPGLNSTVALWNATLTRHFFKKHQAEIRLTIHDILNRAVAVTHSITPLYIEDTRTQVIARYLMVTFAYHFRDLHQSRYNN